MRLDLKTLAAALAIALAPASFAQTTGSPIDAQVVALDKTANNRGQALVASKIASNFASLAGSEENALALVNALRTGEPVNLTYAPTGTATTPTVVTLDPPTGNMGWGNVKISLALAQDQLARLGITNPTAQQLQAALNGGSVSVTNANGTTTTTTLRGVLQMRVDGMGWGEIAHAGGTKVGPVVSQMKMAHAKVATIPVSTAASAVTPNTATVTTAAGAKSVGVTTGAGTKAVGVTTAAGAKSTGVTTAAGASGAAHGSKGITTAAGVASPSASRGLTTAEGAITTQKGNAYGRGVVTAGGSSASSVVTAGGGSASGVTTVHGNAGGNGKGNGAENGKGKGG